MHLADESYACKVAERLGYDSYIRRVDERKKQEAAEAAAREAALAEEGGAEEGAGDG